MHAAGPLTGAMASDTNWAGYELTGTTFTGVAAKWVQPSIVPSASPEGASTWVGIDGVENETLIQAGVDEDTTGGAVGYAAWYEILPAPNTLLPTPVTPGDHMTVVVSENALGTWLIAIQDVTKGWLFKKDFAYYGPGTSAEWIQEDPTLGSGLLPLADWGTVKFTDVKASTPDPTAALLTELTLIKATGTVEAATSTLSTATTLSFTVTRVIPVRLTPGYDLVGSDGGVFVFPTTNTSGFYGSLPGIGVHVGNIVGMVATSDDQGYFLVGSDGGVFSFGDAPFLGSLPGLHVVPTAPITGLVATGTDGGYFLVGRDGGVFAFGNATYLGSLPGIGVNRDDVIGIAATPTGNGYWLVTATGTVYAFGQAKQLGTAKGTSSPVTAIAGTPTGAGYWIITENGTVLNFGKAKNFGTLPKMGVSPSLPVIGIVHTADTGGYWLIGSDGGVFAFGDAGFVGSLPAVGVHVSDVVGAVPTAK